MKKVERIKKAINDMTFEERVEVIFNVRQNEENGLPGCFGYMNNYEKGICKKCKQRDKCLAKTSYKRCVPKFHRTTPRDISMMIVNNGFNSLNVPKNILEGETNTR